MKLNQPFVLKIRYKRNVASNLAHLRYIANKREAVAPERESEVVHARYIAERPQSHGLFGPAGEPSPQLEAIEAELRRTPGPVWQVVLSMREDDAHTLGLVGPERWRDVGRDLATAIGRQLGLSERDFKWVGAYHEKAGQPHIHLLLWQPEGAAYRPAHIRPAELRSIRRETARIVYGPLRSELAAERTAWRDLLVSMGRAAVRGEDLRRARLELLAAGRLQLVNLPPVAWVPLQDQQELSRRLEELAAKLPGHGRVALAYMPPEVKAEARAVADWILSRPWMEQPRRAYLEASRNLRRLYTSRPERLQESEAEAYRVVRDRLAQAALRQAVLVQKGRQTTLNAARRLAGAAHRILAAERARAEAQADLAREYVAERAQEAGRER